ncbi:MAG: DUF4157 domain-containing protein, partial [Chloroflexota bacterium]
MNAADLAGEVVSRWELLVEEVRRRLGPGAHLESAPREFFARRLGYDLGGAAIHRGPFAGRLAAGVGAEALAAGSHVVGDEAALNPDTAQGAALLGHELTHVVQQ